MSVESIHGSCASIFSSDHVYQAICSNASMTGAAKR